MVDMSKNQKIKDSAPGGANLLVQLRKLHKKLTQSVGKLEGSMKDIGTIDDETRKARVQAMTNELYDLAEILHPCRPVRLLVDRGSFFTRQGAEQ